MPIDWQQVGTDVKTRSFRCSATHGKRSTAAGPQLEAMVASGRVSSRATLRARSARSLPGRVLGSWA